MTVRIVEANRERSQELLSQGWVGIGVTVEYGEYIYHLYIDDEWDKEESALYTPLHLKR